jgi:hypothetical protein
MKNKRQAGKYKLQIYPITPSTALPNLVRSSGIKIGLKRRSLQTEQLPFNIRPVKRNPDVPVCIYTRPCDYFAHCETVPGIFCLIPQAKV